MGIVSPTALFVYGSLEIPEVYRALTGRDALFVEATLSGHRRCMLRDRSYPAVVPDPDAYVHASLVPRVDPDLWPILDAFEGHEYGRVAVDVALRGESHGVGEGGERTQTAFVYRLRRDRYDELTREAWDSARFRSERLDEWVVSCAAFRRSFSGWSARPPSARSRP